MRHRDGRKIVEQSGDMRAKVLDEGAEVIGERRAKTTKRAIKKGRKGEIRSQIGCSIARLVASCVMD